MAEGSLAGRTGRAEEVAVFVDFENIRYSTINSYGQEPDPVAWRDKALKYGLMSVAKAYADFDQHPPQVRTRLDVAGFEMHHYPVKRTTDSQGREKLASRSDLNLVVDIINTALVRPDIKTFLLFSGDKDFIRLVTTLRNRLGLRVIICGVPGSISPDLVAAAGEADPLEIEQSEDVDVAVIEAITWRNRRPASSRWRMPARQCRSFGRGWEISPAWWVQPCWRRTRPREADRGQIT